MEGGPTIQWPNEKKPNDLQNTTQKTKIEH